MPDDDTVALYLQRILELEAENAKLLHDYLDRHKAAVGHYDRVVELEAENKRLRKRPRHRISFTSRISNDAYFFFVRALITTVGGADRRRLALARSQHAIRDMRPLALRDLTAGLAGVTFR